jgi:hypothetical protein
MYPVPIPVSLQSFSRSFQTEDSLSITNARGTAQIWKPGIRFKALAAHSRGDPAAFQGRSLSLREKVLGKLTRGFSIQTDRERGYLNGRSRMLRIKKILTVCFIL